MDSLCFILICKADFKNKFVLQADAEKPEQSRQKKNCLAMKTLNFEQMESLKAGRSYFWDDLACGLGGGMDGAIIGGLIGGPVGFLGGLLAGTLLSMACSAGSRLP